LPPLWVDSIEQAEADIAKIQAKSKCAVYCVSVCVSVCECE
jgi:hypothetical protein